MLTCHFGNVVTGNSRRVSEGFVKKVGQLVHYVDHIRLNDQLCVVGAKVACHLLGPFALVIPWVIKSD